MEQTIIKEPHEQIFEMLFEKDEVTWQSIIHDLIKTEQMNPWDVNITLLTQKYIETIKKLKELDFRLSGKVLLAAAILLKIKSNKLVGEDIEYLDRLISDQEEDDLLSFEETFEPRSEENIPKNLIPRTPMPRKRKVSIYDLMDALEKALEVKRRRVLKSIPPMNVHIPEKKRDISKIIQDIYQKIKIFFWENNKSRLTFSQLVPSDSRSDKIYTFVPLLHLTNQRKIDLFQQQHFGEIDILLRQAQEEINKELKIDS
ncbi:MAG: segregation/condensation protein A [Nanoarchaeota archaeon]|nr:segregation/condensation protein A [Nanoarchaeota archaeon]MBU1004519.1 segregation/condensation protein A [Nanoarchaeota archaeon]MBU1945944.1 segregation/condensation protein A [Nanoarchaeota archaeon]